ncbi:MAG: nitrogenase component 1 [Clostridia bacterium]|nr:nitrogenase component 1 [Clostridia bacterium]
MRKYIGSLEDFVAQPELEYDETFWADYQVLGPMFSALRLFMTMEDVLPVIVGAKGCAYHLNFTIVAWGEIDFDLGKRPLPVLQFSQSQIITGSFELSEGWVNRLKVLAKRRGAKRIMLFFTDAMALCGANLDGIAASLEKMCGIETSYVNVFAMSGTNQWQGYKAALEAMYLPLLDKSFKREKSVNLVGWMWPSRKRNQEIGCCISMLNELGIPVNAVISGGSQLSDIEKSLHASANAVVCSSLMGEMLDILDKRGIRLAGNRAPYGFSGTVEWLENIAEALDMDIHEGLEAMRARYLPKFLENKARLKGKKVFVSGGPGRVIGLLHALNDYEMDIQVACMFWPHAWSREDLKHLLQEHGLKVGTFILSPGLDDLEWAAQNFQFDVWMGGYQEQHTCKRYNIPFVPITVYTVTHVGFEGAVNLGNKMLMAMDGHSFVENSFTANEIEGYTCSPN